MPRGDACRGAILVLVSVLLQSPGAGAVRAHLAGLDGLQISHAQKAGSALQVVLEGAEAAIGGSFWGPLAYLACVLFTVVAIVLLYWSRSVSEKFSIIVYLLALSTVRLAVKAVFKEYGFEFPLFLSAVHFVASAAAAFGVLLYRWEQKGAALPVPSVRDFFLTILPIAVCFATCIGVGNNVLELCSIALTEILMATQPIMSVPFVLLLGMPFDPRLLLPTCVVVAGCVVCSLGDVNFSGLGLALAILSNILRAAKASLQQKMLTGEQRGRLEPCALLAWMSLPSAALMFAWSAAVEGRAPLLRLLREPLGQGLAASLLLSSAPAVVLNLSQLIVVAGLGAVGSQIVAQMKIVLTILGGAALLSERVAPLTGVGVVAVLAGTFVFSRWDQAAQAAAKDAKAEAEAEAKAGAEAKTGAKTGAASEAVKGG